MIASPLTWLAIHAAASACGVAAARVDVRGVTGWPAGRARAAGVAAPLKAPLNASAVTATAAATATAAMIRQRRSTHSLIVVARTRPHDGSGIAGLAVSGTGLTVSPAGRPAVSAAGSPAASSVPAVKSMLPGGVGRSSSPTVATLRPYVPATHLSQQRTPACRDEPEMPIDH